VGCLVCGLHGVLLVWCLGYVVYGLIFVWDVWRLECIVFVMFPEGRSPEGKSDYLRDLPWANLPDNA
jgi:hypothetical protein